MTDAAAAPDTPETFGGPDEPHAASGLSRKLNWLRAGVLGANDGIVSVAAVVVGVAGATTQIGPIATAGVAAIVGGAVSMALGEYVSVSSQSDSEKALVAKETRELAEDPEGELAELTEIYRGRGLSEDTAHRVAVELTERDALKAHLEAELGIDAEDIVSPWHAAGASALAFFIGAVLPFLAMILTPAPARVWVTFAVTLVALAATGTISAQIGGSSKGKAAVRVLVGGALALAFTFLVGKLLGASGVV